MQSIYFNWFITRIVRFLVTVFTCALLLFSNAFPAFAVQSSPTKGEEQLTEVEKKAQETVQEKPLSRQETQAETNPGENEIQGTADIDKMKNPETSKTPGVEQKVERALEKILGKS